MSLDNAFCSRQYDAARFPRRLLEQGPLVCSMSVIDCLWHTQVSFCIAPADSLQGKLMCTGCFLWWSTSHVLAAPGRVRYRCGLSALPTSVQSMAGGDRNVQKEVVCGNNLLLQPRGHLARTPEFSCSCPWQHTWQEWLWTFPVSCPPDKLRWCH